VSRASNICFAPGLRFLSVTSRSSKQLESNHELMTRCADSTGDTAAVRKASAALACAVIWRDLVRHVARDVVGDDFGHVGERVFQLGGALDDVGKTRPAGARRGRRRRL
jgi:hypothetical protein